MLLFVVRNSLRRVAMAAVLAATVLPASASGASEGPARSLATPERIASDIAYRQQLSLGADAGYVRALYQRSDADDMLASSHGFGTLFTPAEITEIRSREIAADEGHGALGPALRALPSDTFAGHFIDHQAGRYTVLVTRAADDVRRRLAASMSDPGRLSVRVVAFSEGDLSAAVSRIGEATGTLAANGVELATVGVDVVGNRISATVTSDPDTAAAEIRRVAPKVPVAVERGPRSVRRNNEKRGVTFAPPVRGGSSIERPTTNGRIFGCTTAFVGYVRSGGSFLSNITTYYVLTAGHCGPGGANWIQGTYPLGPVYRSTFSLSTTDADAQAIEIALTDRSNQFITTYNPSTGVPTISHVSTQATPGASADIVGGRVCHTGVTSTTATLYRCGTITSLNNTVNYAADPVSGQPAQSVRNLRFANLHSEPGDSGASIVGIPGVGYQAEGVLSGGPDGNFGVTYFSQIRDCLNATALLAVKTTANSTVD